MSASKEKIVQYLNEAHAMEQGLTRVLQAQIGVAPRGRFRQGLEQHLRETQGHAKRVRSRLSELEYARNPVQLGIGVVQSVVGQAVGLGKAPVDLLRGTGGDEKLLKNAKDACAAESLEIATYTALERLADSVGDERTAELSRAIRTDEERMLERLLDELPTLTEEMVESEIRGEDSFALSETGAADNARAAGRAAKRTVKRTAKRARSSAKAAGTSAKRRGASAKRGSGRPARSAARSSGKGTGATQRRSGATQRRSGATQRRSGATQRRSGATQSRSGTTQRGSGATQSRSGATQRRSGTTQSRSGATQSSPPSSERAREPWTGYDDLNAGEVRTALDKASEERARRVGSYEKAHEDRTALVEKTERDLATS
jgi:ferritin-like metal-binding protein YciE